MTGNFPAGAPVRLGRQLIAQELGELPSVPTEAYLWGRLPPRPRVAIVGSRRASGLGLEVTRRVAGELARQGVCIVSGGAAGIDRAAHEGALGVGGRTLVVGPVWLDRAYPLENRDLFADIVGRSEGGYLAVAGREAQPLRPYFHKRNAALVCLSECVVIGECGATSGALNAAAVARRLGRPRFVLPWSPDRPGTRGSECELLGRGATPYFRSKQILDLLDARTFTDRAWLESRILRSGHRSSASPARRSLLASGVEGDASAHRRVGSGSAGPPGRQQRELLTALLSGPKTVDELCEVLDTPAAVVSHLILLLTLEGVAKTRAGFVELVAQSRPGRSPEGS